MSDDYSKNSNVDWRWTSLPVRVFGLDPLVIVYLPILFITGFDWLAIIGFVGLIALAAYVAMTTKHGSIWKWLMTLRTKYMQGAEWKLPKQ